MQLNDIHCESTDIESDTEYAISINMIVVENDYKPLIYDQPFNSHIYKNLTNFLLNYYTTPRNNNKSIEQTVKDVTTLNEPIKEPVPCSSTNHIYQNVPKEPPREKIWTIPFLLESPKSTEFQQPELKIDF